MMVDQMKPLRVEFELNAPIAGVSMPLHLDALLAYAVTQEALSNIEPGSVPGGTIRQFGENLPLGKAIKDELWCWQASALMPEAVLGHEMRLWTRRTDSELIATMTREGTLKRRREPKAELELHSLKINTSKGILKNHFQYIPVRHVRKLIAYCVGNADRIEELLTMHITTIGARGRTGYGAIRIIDGMPAIRIAEDHSANHMWQMRTMPWPVDGFLPVEAAYRAPYWAAENKAICYMPNEIVF